ncbi:MAG: signal peptidase II [Alicyclobacillus sp.]|nr:signal peptidase II [Alicyclobacillus sp.]
MLVYGLAVVVYALDQWIKWVVRQHMYVGEVIPVIPHVVVLNYIRNPGAAWGLLGGSRWLLVLIAVVVVAAVVFVKSRYRLNWTTQVGLGLLLGGALGNLTDRMVWGTVVDYVYVVAIHYPVFNLADSAIVVGVLLILVRNLFGSGRKQGGADVEQRNGQDL